MKVSKRFVVVKKKDEDIITYYTYKKAEGFNVKPKKDTNIYDMINIDSMVIINPTLIKKLVSKKCSRYLKKILDLLSLMDEDDDSATHLALDELEKFKVLLKDKYKKYMDKEEYILTINKIKILTSEINLRLEKEDEYISTKASRR